MSNRGVAPRYFDELPEGHVFYGTDLTVTESHVVTFAGLTGDFQPLHMNKQLMADSQFGQRVAHGPLTLSLGMGQLAQRIYHENWQIRAALGIQDVRFYAPVFFDDTLSFKGEIVDAKKRDDGGIVTVGLEVRNGSDAVVLTGSFMLMLLQSS